MLKLNLDIQKTQVQLASGNAVSEFTIFEMTQKQRDEYMEKQEPRLLRNPSDNKVIGVKTQAGFFADLLVSCMRDKSGKAVTEDLIQSWPTGTVLALYTEAQKLNGLGKETVDAKKDLPA